MISRPYNFFVATLLLFTLASQGRTANTDDWIDTKLNVLSRENERLERFTLPNGMLCLLKADNSAPVVSVQIWVESGSIHEEQYLGAGISHAIEHMLFKGTPTRGTGVITREIDDAGGRVNAYTTFDRIVFFADLPSRNWKTGFDVLSDAVMNATFPEAEWKLEREVIMREMAMGEDDPNRVLSKHLWQTAFRIDPRRHPVIGYMSAFATLTRDDLIAFFQRHYTPDNMMLVIVGDIDTIAVRKYVSEQLKPFVRRHHAPVLLPQEPPKTSPRLERVTGDYQVSRLAAAWPSVAVYHPDAAALDILANIAGQGRSARLHRSLVEDRKLLHSIDAWSYTPGLPGLFGISATFDPERENEAVTAIQQEMEYLKSIPFTEQEVQKAVRSMIVDQLSGLATMSGQAAQYGSDTLFTGDPRYSETYIQLIRAVTPADLLRVAKQYLPRQTQSIVLLVPAGTNDCAAVAEPPVPTPVVHRIPLDNGATLIVRENNRLPFVYAAVALQGGVRAEPEDKRGMTSLMSELLTRGTASRSREETATTVESLGASLNAYAGFNAFGLTAQCLSSDAETIVTLLADCLLNPLFEETEIDRQRDLQLAAISRQQEQPMFLAQQQLRNTLFPQHPYRNNPEGTVESVRSLTRRDLVEYHRTQVVSENLVISVFGDITVADATALVNTAFTGVIPGNVPAIERQETLVSLPARVQQEIPREQAIVMAGFPGVSIYDPDYEALTVLQTAMSGLSSDLAVEIRDKRGLAYFTGAMQQAGLEPGMFALYAGTQRKDADKVEALFRVELERLSKNGLRDEELNRAKAQLTASHDMGLQNQLSIAQECALNECYGLGADYLFGRPDRIASVTSDAIRSVISRILDTRRMAVSLILPASKDAPAETGN